MKRVRSEISILQASLPTDPRARIHVCFDEDRLDVCRALITGPVGTPYAMGVFEFDLYLPPQYPRVPPKVHFLTTAHAAVRMNPNLVCDTG
jgi:baculoviral IAP repeat-containing protein 6